MGERSNNRKAFENVVGRIVQHERMAGREPNERAAREQAAGVARQRDYQRDDGSAKNRNAGRKPEVAPPRVASGRVTVDMGRKR
jgi:hypothetical protein